LTLLNQLDFRDWRAWVTAGACGRVLEVGAGTGPNFSYYDPCAQVIAFDPDPEALEEIEDAQQAAARTILLQASAEVLPFPDEYFDAAVGTLVFCTIPHPRRALDEIRRVLKPGASLRLVEHVRARNPLLGALMDAATPWWKGMAGGCHLNRNTLDTVRSAGFEVLSVQKKWRGLVIGIEARK
jgi:ubiquinone/menaquinone biosynthesis C-methylase UbiE